MICSCIQKDKSTSSIWGETENRLSYQYQDKQSWRSPKSADTRAILETFGSNVVFWKLKDLSISVTEAKQEESFNELIKFFDQKTPKHMCKAKGKKSVVSIIQEIDEYHRKLAMLQKYKPPFHFIF